jgi:FAD/FMN-containing dehydrogenase
MLARRKRQGNPWISSEHCCSLMLESLRRSPEVAYDPRPKFHGAVSAEHGIGLEKKAWMALSRSAAEIELMRVLKRAIDPKSILNRGKVIDSRELGELSSCRRES